MHSSLRRAGKIIAVVAVGTLCAAALVLAAGSWWFAPDEGATARYPLMPSPADFDGDGIDDYTDILDGARAEAMAAPAYDAGYYEGGYPPDDRGACTDTVWRAFATAGYNLKGMVDADIVRDPTAYARVVSSPDPNIDFRRVDVLQVFFSRYAVELGCDTADAASWQAGDIVVFGDAEHIGIVSDRRDARGVPFIIHNMGQPFREEDYLAYPWAMRPKAHYRFDATRVASEVLVAFSGALPSRSAIGEFTDECIEQAREETYLAESEGRMLPAGERTWLTPEEYESGISAGVASQP